MIGNAQMWGGLLWLAVGAFVAFQGRVLGLGTTSEPGSGFALWWIGLMMCALSASEIVKAVVKGGDSIAGLWTGTRWEKVLIVTIMLLIFGFLFETIGFIFCSLAMLLILMFFIDPVGPRRAITVSVLATFIVWAVLTEALKIQMPAGILAGAPEDAMRAFVRSAFASIGKILR